MAHDHVAQQCGRSLPVLIERHDRFQTIFAALARWLHDEQRLNETFSDHYGYRQPVGATPRQIHCHNTQHRSEVRHMLERLGVVGLWDFDPQEWEHATGRVV